MNNNKQIDSDFDGHLEKPLSVMSPKEKLLYLSLQIKLRFFYPKQGKESQSYQSEQS